jgi:hypothetical protein
VSYLSALLKRQSEISARPINYETIKETVQILEAFTYASIGLYIIKSSKWCDMSPIKTGQNKYPEEVVQCCKQISKLMKEMSDWIKEMKARTKVVPKEMLGPDSSSFYHYVCDFSR